MMSTKIGCDTVICDKIQAVIQYLLDTAIQTDDIIAAF